MSRKGVWNGEEVFEINTCSVFLGPDSLGVLMARLLHRFEQHNGRNNGDPINYIKCKWFTNIMNSLNIGKIDIPEHVQIEIEQCVQNTKLHYLQHSTQMITILKFSNPPNMNL